jgi:hypothetical protein
MRFYDIQTLFIGMLGTSLISALPTELAPVSIPTIGTPVESVLFKTATLEKRGRLGGMYMCKDKNFQGECTYIQLMINDCWNFPYAWTNTVAPLGPIKHLIQRMVSTVVSIGGLIVRGCNVPHCVARHTVWRDK